MEECYLLWNHVVQSEPTQGHLCFCVSATGDPPCIAHIKHTENTNVLYPCTKVCCVYAAPLLTINAMPFFHPRRQILKHCCLNHNCSLLFLPHPHLSVRVGRYSTLSSAGCSNRPDWHDTAQVAHACTHIHTRTYTQQRTEGILSDLNPSWKPTVSREMCIGVSCLPACSPAVVVRLHCDLASRHLMTHTHTYRSTHTHTHMQICKRHLQHVSMISFTLKTHLQHTCINYNNTFFFLFSLFSSNKKSNKRFSALSAAELKYKHTFAVHCF